MLDICQICKYPRLLEIDNLILTGQVSAGAISRLLEKETIFVEPEDIAFHIEHCMSKATSVRAARKTLIEIAEIGRKKKAAYDNYKMLDAKYSCIPPGESDLELLQRVGNANLCHADLQETQKDLQVRYDLQIKAIEAKKLYQTQMKNIEKAALKTRRAESNAM